MRQDVTGIMIALLALGGAGCGKAAKPSETVRVWHWMTDREEAFNELARRYKQETGTDVRFELYAPSDVYVQKVRAAAQTNGLPEVYGILGEMRDLASFISAGHVLPLEPFLSADDNAWRSVFFPNALAVNAFAPGNPHGIAPGVYGVPIDVMNIQLFYNKKHFRMMGLDPEKPPQTWQEFIAIATKAREHNLIGFVSGWAELWLIDCFATNYAVHEMDQRKVEATYRGQLPYTAPPWIKVLSLFAEMRDDKILAEGIVTMVNKRAEQFFANEQAVFAFNGTWGVNVYRNMNPAIEYGVMMPPRLNNKPMVTWGGAGSSFFINPASANQPKAVAFLQWLTAEPQQKFLMEQTQNIPANRIAAASLPPELAAFADDMEATIHPRLFAAQEDSAVIEAFDKGIQSILIGEATPAQVAGQVQEVKTRESARRAQLQPTHASR